MANSEDLWTNQEILHELLWAIVEHIYETASQSIEIIREAALDENPARLKERLISLQMGVVVGRIFSYIDGANGPTEWPGLKLVNGVTKEVLSDNLALAFAKVEGEYILATEPPIEDD